MAWKYGRKIIDALFAGRAKRAQVCTKFESRAEADSDRSDIRVFEVGLSVEQSGNHEQSARIIAQEVATQLVGIAKANGLYIPKCDWDAFGDRKRVPSGESIVYLDNLHNQVVKVRNPFAKSAIKQLRAEDMIYEHLFHNILFPDTRYQFMGISEDVDGVRIVLSQPYIPDQFTLPAKRLIDDYLAEGLGLRQEGRYFYGNDYLAVTDVSPMGDNVLYDGKKLYFIDPIICLKKPAQEVLAYYDALLE